MPISFHFNHEAKLMICVHTGSVMDKEFFVDYKSMLESDLFTTDMNLLIDLSQTDSSSRSGDILRQLAEYVKIKLSEASTYPKVAVVAPKDISFGFARMYEFLADSIPWDFVVFRSADTALAWLRVPEDLMDDLERKTRQVISPDNKDTDSDVS